MTKVFGLFFLQIVLLIFGVSASFNAVANIVPLTLSPVETISKTTPRFYWTVIPGVENYLVRVWSGGTIVSDELTTDGLYCNSNSCSFRKTGTSFPNGSYTWRVKPFFPNGQSGSWSKSQNFTVDTTISVVSSEFTQLTPNTTINSTIPTFIWNPVPNINKYVIKIFDSQGSVAFSGLTPNGFSCSETLCSYSRPTWSLTDGASSWQIRTEADDGTNGTWSEPVEFSVDTLQSRIPKQLYPTVNTATSTPQFAWKELDGYTKYAIRLRDNNRNVLLSKVTPNNFSCPDGVCYYNAEGVSFSGSGSWQIRTEAMDGTDGPWSDYLSFRIVTSNSRWKPKTISPTGIIDTPTLTFKWETSYNEAYKYAVRVLDSSGAVLFNSITPSNLDCTGGICSYVKQGVTLPQNEILSWTIRTEGADGANGDMSSPQYFQIGGDNVGPIAVITPSTDNVYQAANTLSFDGIQSIDPEQAQLTYKWKLVSRPLNSNVYFNRRTASNLSDARFYADKGGTYVISLTVSDGLKNSTVLLNVNVVTITTDGSPSPIAPDINTFTSDVSQIQLGQSVRFEINVTDQNNDKVTCYLDFVGDNKTIQRIDDCQNRTTFVEHEYADIGHYTPRLIVTDGNHNPVFSYNSYYQIKVNGSISFNDNSWSRKGTGQYYPEKISFSYRATSEYEIISAKVRILDSRIINNEVSLGFSGSGGGGELIIGDILSTGEYMSEYTLEDVFGNKAVWYFPFHYEQSPKFTANLPLPYSVISSPVLDASCSFDGGDCEIGVHLGASRIFSAVNELPPTPIDFSSYTSRRSTLSIKGVIQSRLWRRQDQELSSLIYIENSDKLTLVDSVPGQIFDANESKILYQLPNDLGGYEVHVYDRVTETSISSTIPLDRQLDRYTKSYLTAKGAIFKASTLFELHQDDGLLSLEAAHHSKKVSGDYAIWTKFDKKMYLKEVSTGSTTYIDDVHTSSDVASNGILVYTRNSPRGLMRYDAKTGITDLLKPYGGSAYFDEVKTDSNAYVYRTRELDGSDINQLIYSDGTTEEVLDSATNPLDSQFQINNGWIAFTKKGSNGQPTLWVRSPLGIVSRRTYYSNSIEIETLGNNGDVMFTRWNTDTGRSERYLSTDSDDPNPTSIHLNQIDSRSLQIDGIWHVYIGNSLFQVKRPVVEVTAEILLYLTADKGGLWNTSESVSRIATVFTEEEIKTTFITFNDVLHAYKDWTEVDAPYATAHTRDSYSEYVLELEYKWGSKKFNPRLIKPKDAGIIFHVYGPSNEPWPSGLEYQLKEPDQYGAFVSVRTRANVTHTNGIYDDTAVPVLVGREVGAQHIDVNIVGPINLEWNAVRLEVSGDSGVYYFNDEKVMEFTDAEYYDHNKEAWFPLTHGRIILQAEGAEIEYRNVSLKPLVP